MPAKRLTPPETSTSGSRATRRGDDEPKSDVRRLESALKSTRRRHEALARQLEANSRELKAATAQLNTVSTELSAVSGRLGENARELVSRNDDLANLLAAVDVAAVFVDRDIQVRRSTTAATHLFNLGQSDI